MRGGVRRAVRRGRERGPAVTCALGLAGGVRVSFVVVREYRCGLSNLAVLVLVVARVKMGSVFWARRVP